MHYVPGVKGIQKNKRLSSSKWILSQRNTVLPFRVRIKGNISVAFHNLNVHEYEIEMLEIPQDNSLERHNQAYCKYHLYYSNLCAIQKGKR